VEKESIATTMSALEEESEKREGGKGRDQLLVFLPQMVPLADHIKSPSLPGIGYRFGCSHVCMPALAVSV